MKKNSILIAAFAMIAAASAIQAQEAAIDFDGGSASPIRSVNFAIAHAEIDQEVPEIPAPQMVSSGNRVQEINSLSSEDLEKLNNRLNSSIRTAIDYCDRNHLDVLKNNFADLLTRGTVKEKYGFVNNSSGKYTFQNKKPFGSAILEPSAGQQKGANPYCVAWGTQNVCVDKTVCKYTCVIVGATAATWGSVNGVWQIIIPAAVGTEVCKDICENVPICADVPYCTQWELDVAI